VVKLAGNNGLPALARELIGSMLAEHFRLAHPRPAIVRIHPDLLPWLERSVAAKARTFASSGGLNFGSEYLVDTPIWPIGRSLSDQMIPSAAAVFAFEALISNDDRRRTNPNILVRGDKLFVIDHELAFSFLHLLVNKGQPWELNDRRNLQEHVFFWQLRKKSLDFGDFIGRLAELSESVLESIIRSVPEPWKFDGLPKISQHLIGVRNNAKKFELELAGRLA